MNQGKFVVVTIFLVAAAAAVFAWWHQFYKGQRALKFWGAESALLIRLAPTVELLELAEASDQRKKAVISDETYGVAKTIDISQAPGLVHARQSLIEDSRFLWNAERGDCRPQWQYVIRFRDQDRVASVALDLKCRRVRRLGERPREATIDKRLAEGLAEFLGEL